MSPNDSARAIRFCFAIPEVQAYLARQEGQIPSGLDIILKWIYSAGVIGNDELTSLSKEYCKRFGEEGKLSELKEMFGNSELFIQYRMKKGDAEPAQVIGKRKEYINLLENLAKRKIIPESETAKLQDFLGFLHEHYEREGAKINQGSF